MSDLIKFFEGLFFIMGVVFSIAGHLTSNWRFAIIGLLWFIMFLRIEIYLVYKMTKK